MITRNERGKLSIKHLDMSIMFDDLFEKCQTEQEVEWLQEQIIASVEGAMYERICNL